MTWVIFGVGFLAQGLFSARILVQWFLSEKKKQVVTPSLFWIFSLLGSTLFFIYGGLRHDFSIILGQLLSYYIYIWNLHMQGIWQKLPRWLCTLIIALPVVMAVLLVGKAPEFFQGLFQSEEVPLFWLLFGSLGQSIFALRFVYQFLYSRRHHASRLPRGFWLQSLIGSLMIMIYACFRLDPVLILGQSFGFFSYIRNLMLKQPDNNEKPS